jgi:hypothetical protein
MHSNEDEQLGLKPENDEKEVMRQKEERFHDHLFTKGWEKGWADAVDALRVMGLEDSATKLEESRQGALDRA